MSFREIRKARRDQALSEEESRAIIDRATHGVLALLGDEGYPYAVPLSHARLGDTIYFHSAVRGHKMDALARGDKASYCIVDADQVVAEEFSTAYRSVIAWGRVSIIADDEEKRAALSALADRYCKDGIASDYDQKLAAEIARSWPAVLTFKLEIEHLSGKQGRLLAGGA
ncbi:MAG: pyridoxamine 5'-phosphate oxidase family protein [Actinomycetia bacterium]|nr:pyridoxamine 5'-phosphate oxidase family protein [Actinomycetes bacterium]